ncbi:MAG: TolC family protein, partial [Fidelibacterota bacterium]
KNLDEIIPVFERTKQAAEEDLRLAQERYNLGAATILDVLDAQLSVVRANSSLVTATYDRKILQAELRALMGKT